jgi:hypothetical protein
MSSDPLADKTGCMTQPDPEATVIQAAEAYTDAMYSAKFARTLQVDERTIQRSQVAAIGASRALIEAVGKLRESRKPKVVLE